MKFVVFSLLFFFFSSDAFLPNEEYNFHKEDSYLFQRFITAQLRDDTLEYRGADPKVLLNHYSGLFKDQLFFFYSGEKRIIIVFFFLGCGKLRALHIYCGCCTFGTGFRDAI